MSDGKQMSDEDRRRVAENSADVLGDLANTRRIETLEAEARADAAETEAAKLLADLADMKRERDGLREALADKRVAHDLAVRLYTAALDDLTAPSSELLDIAQETARLAIECAEQWKQLAESTSMADRLHGFSLTTWDQWALDLLGEDGAMESVGRIPARERIAVMCDEANS